jgi:hypothetical protein
MKKYMALAALAAACPLASANIVVNGSFEDPALTNLSDDGLGIYWYTFVGANGFTGWTHPFMVGAVDRPGAWEASHGLQYINIESSRGFFIEQRVPTTPGATYLLSFDYAPDPFETPGSTESDIGVYFGGNLVGIASGDDSTVGNLNWTNYSLQVTSTSSLTLLRFEDRGSAGSTGGYLDNVSLVLIPTPASLGLLIGAAPLLARRRR